jgi:hypothetical protein
MPTQASSLWPREFSRRSRRSPREGSEGTRDREHQTSTVPTSSSVSATPSKSGVISSITDENASWSSENFKPGSLICDFCTNPEGKDDNYLSWLEKVPQLGECPNCAMMRNAKLALEAFSHQEIWHISLPTLVEDGLSFHATGSVSGTETYEIYASGAQILTYHVLYSLPSLGCITSRFTLSYPSLKDFLLSSLLITSQIPSLPCHIL